jgi:hypothetical protein
VKQPVFILAAALGLVGFNLASPVQAAPYRSVSDSLTSGFGSSAVSEVVNADGSVTDTWRVSVPGQSALRVATTGPAHMTVGVAGTGKHLVVSATPPPVNKASISRAAASPGSIYRSWCVQAWPGRGYIRACDVQRWAQQNGADWYLADEQEATGSDPGWIYGVEVHVNWSANNQIVHWSPSGAVPTGSCNGTSVSVGWGGLNFSQSWTACPEEYYPSCGGNTCFGAGWIGFTSGTSRGVGAVDLVHDPPNAYPGTTLYTSWAMN